MAPRKRLKDTMCRDDVLAYEASIKDVNHHEVVTNTTILKQKRAEEDWRDFCEVIGEDPTKCLSQNRPVPATERLKNFMREVRRSTKGLIQDDGAPTETTLSLKWDMFKTMFERITGTTFSRELSTEIRTFIRSELAPDNPISRDKPLVDFIDIQLILTFLWLHDTFDYQHPREHCQLDFFTVIVSPTGTRPGTVVESSAYAGSNECLKYRDCNLFMMDNGEGYELYLLVSLTLFKGERGAKKKLKPTIVPFHEDRECRGLCPVTRFLGFAFADQAFSNCDSPEALHNIKIPDNLEVWPLKIKESMMDIPVLRSYDQESCQISPTRSLTYSRLNFLFQGLGERMGLEKKLKTYNLRRGLANMLYDVIGHDDYSKLLNHTRSVFKKFYQSNISNVDGQNLIQGKNSRPKVSMNGMHMSRDLDAPTDLPFATLEALVNDPEYKRLRAAEQILTDLFSKSDKKKGSKIYDQLSAATVKRKRWFLTHQDRARRDQWTKHFANIGATDIQSLPKSVERSAITRRFTEILKNYFPAREYVGSQFFPSSTVQHSDVGIPSIQLLTQLIELCQPSVYVLHYPNQQPINDKCPNCGMQFTSKLSTTSHIHECIRSKKRMETRKLWENGLTTCCNWTDCQIRNKRKLLPCDSAICAHTHLDSGEVACRNISHAKLQGKVAIRKFKAYCTHFQTHMEAKGFTCKWGLCRTRCNNPSELRRHILDVHNIMTRGRPFEPQYCLDHPRLGWFVCEFEWEDHCREHLKPESLSMVCNGATYYGVCVKEYLCPFCLGNTKLSYSGRLTTFAAKFRFNKHISQHFQTINSEQNFNCPHPLCHSRPLGTVRELEAHFFDDHKLAPTGFTKSLGIRKRTLDGEFKSHSLDCL